MSISEMNYEDILKLCRKLSKYSDLEHCELGDGCRTLMALTHHTDCFSDEFNEMVVNEIKSLIKYFEENFEIVEREETTTNSYTELEYVGD